MVAMGGRRPNMYDGEDPAQFPNTVSDQHNQQHTMVGGRAHSTPVWSLSLADSACVVSVQPAGPCSTYRRSVNILPQGVYRNTPKGVRFINSALNGDPWFVGSSVKLLYSLAHTMSTPNPTGDDALDPGVYTVMLMPRVRGPWYFQ